MSQRAGRAWLRDKALRVVEEVVARHHREQAAQMEEVRARLEAELGELRRELVGQADRLVEFERQMEIRERHDLFAATERRAVDESATLCVTEMSHAPRFGSPEETLAHALSLAPTGGLALELGVYSGTTLEAIAQARADGEVYGFDSFEGLPESWRTGFPPGTFAVKALPEVPGAKLVAGWFADTLEPFLAEHDDPVDLLHVDCDLYSSTRTALDLLGPRLRSGTVVVFDEYFNFPGWQDHEFRAWREYVERTDTRFSYQGYTIDNEQVVIRIEPEDGR